MSDDAFGASAPPPAPVYANCTVGFRPFDRAALTRDAALGLLAKWSRQSVWARVFELRDMLADALTESGEAFGAAAERERRARVAVARYGRELDALLDEHEDIRRFVERALPGEVGTVPPVPADADRADYGVTALAREMQNVRGLVLARTGQDVLPQTPPADIPSRAQREPREPPMLLNRVPSAEWLLQIASTANRLLRLCREEGIVEGAARPTTTTKGAPRDIFKQLCSLGRLLQQHPGGFGFVGWRPETTADISRYVQRLRGAVERTYELWALSSVYHSTLRHPAKIMRSDKDSGTYEALIVLGEKVGPEVTITWPYPAIPSDAAEALETAARYLEQCAGAPYPTPGPTAESAPLPANAVAVARAAVQATKGTEPTPPLLLPPAAAPAELPPAAPCPIRIKDLTVTVQTVTGKWSDIRLAGAAINSLRALVDAYPDGLTAEELRDKVPAGDPVKPINAARAAHPELAAVIRTPGKGVRFPAVPVPGVARPVYRIEPARTAVPA